MEALHTVEVIFSDGTLSVIDMKERQARAFVLNWKRFINNAASGIRGGSYFIRPTEHEKPFEQSINFQWVRSVTWNSDLFTEV